MSGYALLIGWTPLEGYHTGHLSRDLGGVNDPILEDELCNFELHDASCVCFWLKEIRDIMLHKRLHDACELTQITIL